MRFAALAATLALAAGVRIANLASARSDAYLAWRVGDEQHFHDWALRIAHGELGRGATFFTTPLYAYVLAVAYRVGGDDLGWIRLLNVALGVAAVALTYLAARHALAPWPSVVAALVVGGCLAPVFYESLPEKTSLVFFLTALALWAIARAGSRRRPSAWVLAGASVGLAALAHALLVVLVPCAWFDIVVRGRHDRRRALAALAAFTGAAALAVAPATLHNYLADGELVAIASNGGHNFYLGNHAGNLTGRYTSPPFSTSNLAEEEAGFRREAERRTGRTLGAAAVSAFWYRQGWRDVLSVPGTSLARFARKAWWAVSDEEITDSRTFSFYRARMPVLALPLPTFGAVAVIGLLGFFLAGRDRRLLVHRAFVVALVVVLALFLVTGRYRLPLLVPFAILGAAMLARYVDAARHGRLRDLAVAAVAGAGIAWMIFGRVPAAVPESFFVDYYNQGNQYLRQGRYDLAAAEYEQALWVRPGNHAAIPLLVDGLADLYERLGRRADAERLLTRAIARDPDNAAYRAALERLRAAAGPIRSRPGSPDTRGSDR